jgi:hypothetical protein
VLANLPSITTFTIEQGEDIYILGQFNCTDPAPSESAGLVQSILSTPLTGSGDTTLLVAADTALLESFTETVIIGFNNFAVFYSAESSSACPLTGNPSGTATLTDSVNQIGVMRMYRSANQLLPGI